jgi:hypothetical protein
MFIESAGLFAPGLESWATGSEVLAGRARYRFEPLPKYKPLSLPPNERRRATEVVRLAFGACEDAIGERREEAAKLASVFAASGGDFNVNDQLCRVLASDQRLVSPTQFHNSVHNAAAGYWSIATHSLAPSVSLSAYDFSVAAGLIEAAGLVTQERWPTLLALYDNSVGWPMQAVRNVKHAFSAALWLTPERSAASLAAISLELSATPQSDTVSVIASLEMLRLGNPAARSIPLLELVAAQRGGQVSLATAGGQALLVEVTPC